MTMVAFPLFIIAGGFIKRGGIGEHLVNFVNLLLGRVKGGLAMIRLLRYFRRDLWLLLCG